MWSTAFTSRMSALNAQQRVLFRAQPLGDHEATAQQGAALRDLHRRRDPRARRRQCAAQGARDAAERVHEERAALAHAICDRDGDRSIAESRTAAWSRKAYAAMSATFVNRYAALECADAQMIAIQSAGLVSHIGVSDFTFQQVEFILMALTDHPPTAFSLAASVIHSSSSEKEPNHTRLATAVSFAHGKDMDVTLRFPFRALERMSLTVRDTWRRLTHAVAQKHRAQTFQVAITHEADKESFQMQQRSMSDTLALQSPLQVVMRYLMQKGVVVIPMASDFESDGENSNEENLEDEECHELFYSLLHPFAALAPSYSANQLHSSVLSGEDLVAIDHTLLLGCHPAPHAS